MARLLLRRAGPTSSSSSSGLLASPIGSTILKCLAMTTMFYSAAAARPSPPPLFQSPLVTAEQVRKNAEGRSSVGVGGGARRGEGKACMYPLFKHAFAHRHFATLDYSIKLNILPFFQFLPVAGACLPRRQQHQRQPQGPQHQVPRLVLAFGQDAGRQEGISRYVCEECDEYSCRWKMCRRLYSLFSNPSLPSSFRNLFPLFLLFPTYFVIHPPYPLPPSSSPPS